MTITPKIAATAAALAVAAAVVGIAPGTASAAQRCDYSWTTGKYGCSGSSGVRGPNDVIGGRVFSGLDYSGDALTIWVPRPCPQNGKVDYSVKLGSLLSNRVGSVQAWSTCWVWLYDKDGNREGPFKGNTPDVSWTAPTATVGLS